MYIETSAPRVVSDKARLSSPKMPAVSSNCRLRFFYHMHGANVFMLRVYQKRTSDSGTGTLIWSMTNEQGNTWHGAVVALQATNQQKYVVVFEATRGDSFKGDIAIDDISFTAGCYGNVPSSNPQPKPLQPGDWLCTLSNKWVNCGWSNAPNNNRNWVTGGPKPTSYSGPVIDHTTKSTSTVLNYAYVTNMIKGQTATLQTALYDHIGHRCVFEFAYFMNGGAVGSLEVALVTPTGDRTRVWYASGQQGSSWRTARVQLGATSQQARVHIIATASSSSGSNTIALDDLRFDFCSHPGYVDFEQRGFGLFHQSLKDDFNWTRTTGATATTRTGPRSDHTTMVSFGHYAYIEASATTGRWHNDIARLESEVLPNPAMDNCRLHFYYNMYGTGIDSLNIYTNASGSLKLVWSKTGDRGKTWRHGVATLTLKTSYTVHCLLYAILFLC